MFTLINTVLLIVIIVILSRKKLYVEISDRKDFDRNRRK